MEILPSDKKASSPPASVYKIEHQVGAILSAIHQWLPKADFTNGLIQVRSAAPSGAARQEKTNFELRVSQAIWTNGTLWAKTEWLRTSNSVWTGKVQARVDTSPYDIVIVSEPLHLATNIRVYDQGGTLHVESTNLWWTNLVVASAQFGPEGAVPSVANIRADSFKIAAEALGLNDFEDLAGSGSFAWQQEHFALDLTTAAHPKFSTQWLAIDVQVHSTGNIHSAFIEKARISSPWLLAELTPGTELNFSSPFLQQDAILKVSLNLNRQPWFASEGQLNGQVVLRPSQEKFPALSFDFSGAGIGLTNIQTKTLAVKGEFR